MKSKLLLEATNLNVSTDGKHILHGIDIHINKGEIHVVMGPNGSGKSTLLMAIMGHPFYTIEKIHDINYCLCFEGEEIGNLVTAERAKKGIFLAMQSPVAIPGVSVLQIIRSSFMEINNGSSQNQIQKKIHNPLFLNKLEANKSLIEFMKNVNEAAKKLHIPGELLSRGINDGFSGGERKKIEMLQALVLKPKLAMFDEIDTGLDVDALRIVAEGINQLKREGASILLVTHYQRILSYIRPDYVHILVGGKIIETGDGKLAKQIENVGYKNYANK